MAKIDPTETVLAVGQKYMFMLSEGRCFLGKILTISGAEITLVDASFIVPESQVIEVLNKGTSPKGEAAKAAESEPKTVLKDVTDSLIKSTDEVDLVRQYLDKDYATAQTLIATEQCVCGRCNDVNCKCMYCRIANIEG